MAKEITPGLCDIKEVAHMCGCTVEQIRAWATINKYLTKGFPMARDRLGEKSSGKQGVRLYWRRTEVEQWIKEQAAQSR